MKKIYFILSLLITTTCFSQTERKVSSFLSFGANNTIYDRTITNNAVGFGFGLQTLISTKTKLRPLLEINADLFAGTKELYLTPDETPIDAKSEMLGLYAGAQYQATNRLFISTTIGSSRFNGNLHFGFRPSIGFYPTQSKKWTLRTSFTHIFQRDAISNESFGYLSLALAAKLF